MEKPLSSPSGTETRIVELLKHIGLYGPEVQIMDVTSRPFSPKLSFALLFEFEITMEMIRSSTFELEKYLLSIRDRVENSKLVQGIRGEYEDKLRKSETRENELIALVEELTKYKNYYDIEMSLRHGGKE